MTQQAYKAAGELSNRQILERIVGDLNELIDKRGNTHLIPSLVEMKRWHEEVCDLERMCAVLERAWMLDADYPDEPYTGDEPLGTCVIHGDYWTDDCVKCAGGC